MRKHHKFICYLFVCILIVFSIPNYSNAATSKTAAYKDAELARAVSLGIGVYEKNNPITFKKFFAMLDKVVKLSNPSALLKWKNQFTDARNSTKTMKRDDGMLATFYASRMMGKAYDSYNISGNALINKIGEAVWQEMSWNYPLFSGWNKAVIVGGDKQNNYMTAAYFYNMCRQSKTSDQIIFDYDTRGNSMRLNKDFNYEDALRAAVRLYDSGLSEINRVPTGDDKKIIASADARRKAILRSKSSITVPGTAYYISNSGNDNNDGMSPATAWATIGKANRMNFHRGDAVLLERGGVYRDILKYRDDIIYAAYGKGEKPKILGSPENGADPAKWILMKGTKNIWIFYKDIYETGAIIFNDGESWANRKTGIWDGKRYVEVLDKKKAVDITKLDNLKFFHDVEYTGYSTENAIAELDIPGTIYLRCDAGNPGKIYDSIEFLSKPYTNPHPASAAILQVGRNCIIDNLCLMYCQAGISIGGNSTVSNCEVAWIGGSVAGYNGATLGADTAAVIRFGDGILCAGGSDSNVLNNYVHHIYDFGITMETGGWQTDSERYITNSTFQGNLVEKCSGGYLIADWEALQTNRDKLIFKNINIEDNYAMYSGYGWSHRETDYDWGYAGQVNNGNSSLVFAFPPKAAQNINAKNNVLYLSRYALISTSHGGNGLKNLYQINLSRNTYVQNGLGILANWQTKDTYKYVQSFLYNLNAKKTVTDILGDKKGIVLSY